MSKIKESEVRHIAKLARISLTDEEVEKFSKQLGSIIEYFKQLSEINTSQVQPTSQVTGLVNNLREDVSKNQLKRTNAMKNASRKKDGYFVTLSSIGKK